MVELSGRSNRSPNDGQSSTHAKPKPEDPKATSTLLSASQDGDMRLILQSLERGANINASDNDGYTPLIKCASTGNASALRVLIEHGANVNACTTEGVTPLMNAAAKCHGECVRILLTNHAEITVIDSDGWTALMFACQSGTRDCVRSLAAASTENSIDLGTGSGITALMICSTKNRPDLISILYENGANVNAVDLDGWSALHFAAKAGSKQCISILIKYGAIIELSALDSRRALMVAAAAGKLACIQELLDHGAFIDAGDNTNWTALIFACSKGQLACVKELVERGASITATDDDTWTPLHYAAASGNSECVKYLLEKGADVDPRDIRQLTPLMVATAKGNASCLPPLLEHGADVNAYDDEQWNSLHKAASRGHTACIKALLECSLSNTSYIDEAGTSALLQIPSSNLQNLLDIDAIDGQNWTALHKAAIDGNVEITKMLLDAGASIEAGDAEGWTAAMKAASRDHAECLKVLIDAGARVDATEEDGWTALMIAVVKSATDCVQLLLSVGADVSVAAYDGKTALSIAESNNFDRCARMIRNALNEREARSAQHRPGSADVVNEPVVPMPGAASTVNSDSTYVPSTPSAIPMVVPQIDTVVPPSTVLPPGFPTSQDQTSSMTSNLVSKKESLMMVSPSELKFGEQLSSRPISTARNAKYKGRDVVVTSFDLPALNSEELPATWRAKIEAQADVLATSAHPNLVSFLGLIPQPPGIITEKMTRGCLKDLIQRAKTDPITTASDFHWHRRLEILIGAAEGITFLQSRTPPILHRGLKSSVIFIDNDGEVKISNTNLAATMEEAVIALGRTDIDIDTLKSPHWLPQEVIQTGEWLSSSDVYSFGVIMWEMLTWETPWNHLKNPFMIIPSILKGDRLPVPVLRDQDLPGPPPGSNETYDRYITLMERCMHYDPAQRPTFAEVSKELSEMAVIEGGEIRIERKCGGENDGGLVSACVVCTKHPCNTALVHVEDRIIHLCCCEECAEKLQRAGHLCPICRRDFISMKVY